MKRQLCRTLLLLASFVLLAATPAFGQTIHNINPTDTNYDSRVGIQMGNLPASLGLIQQKETSTGANHINSIVAVMDTGVDAGHPDLAGQVVLAVNYVANTSVSFLHGTGMAGYIAALINGQFIVSPGGLFPGRVPVADIHWANDENDATAINLRKVYSRSWTGNFKATTL
jgi:subtilisin family serine protease